LTAPLKKNGKVSIGYYGQDGKAFQFTNDSSESKTCVDFFRLFVSSDPVDLSDAEQSSPLFGNPRGMRRKAPASLPVAWDARTIPVIICKD
jgi:hypothetical protein